MTTDAALPPRSGSDTVPSRDNVALPAIVIDSMDRSLMAAQLQIQGLRDSSSTLPNPEPDGGSLRSLSQIQGLRDSSSTLSNPEPDGGSLRLLAQVQERHNSSSTLSNPEPDGGSFRKMAESSSGDEVSEEPVQQEESISSDDREWVLHAKAALIPIVFVITIGSSYIPWCLHKYLSRAVDIMMVGATFTAGIILGAGMSHLMVDANEAFVEYFAAAHPEDESEEDPYPAASAIAAASFLVLVWADAMITHRTHVSSHHHTCGTGSTAAHVVAASDLGHSHMVPRIPQSHLEYEAKCLSGDKDKDKVAPEAAKRDQNVCACEMTSAPSTKTKESAEPSVRVDVAPIGSSGTNTSTHHASTVETTDATPTVSGTRGKVQAWVFFILLSLHSVFDGLSVGAETDRRGFLVLLLAVAGHKMLDGFALGVPLFFSGWSKWHMAVAIFFCAAMMPLGMGIAMVVESTTEGPRALLARGCILSVSAGSFFFISLMELLPSSLANGKMLSHKMTACVAGWGLMALLAAYV